MRKFISAIIAATLCVILLVGCVNNDTSPNQNSNTPKEDTNKKDTPKEDTNKKDTPKEDANKNDTPKEDPIKDSPDKNDPPQSENDTSLKGEINAKIIFHESFSENNYFILSPLKSKDKETLVKDIIENLKNLPAEEYFKRLEHTEFMPIPKTLKVNSVKIGNNVVTVDFNENFSNGLGSSGEINLLQSIVNSIGVNLNVEKVIITFNGENYSSGHISKNNGEGFTVSKKSPRELKK